MRFQILILMFLAFNCDSVEGRRRKKGNRRMMRRRFRPEHRRASAYGSGIKSRQDGNSRIGSELRKSFSSIDHDMRRLSKRAFRPQLKYPYRPAVRAKSKTIEAIQVNLVDNEPLYEYNIYLLPMGRRLKGKIPDKPENIDTQYKEYKVNMDDKVTLMNCKKTHLTSTNLICDSRSRKMQSRYSQSAYVPPRPSKYYFMRSKTAPKNDDTWRKYLSIN